MRSSLKGVFRPRGSRSQSPLPPPHLTPEIIGAPNSQSPSSQNLLTQTSQTVFDQASSASIGEGQNYGVHVLYDGGPQASVDIVFVHGFTGNAYNTWLYKDKGSRVHWPSELLKQDLPNERIMSFGYDADIVNLWNPRSHTPLTGHAGNMVGAVARKRERTNTEDRKILFVGHSLGGLVIEHALSHSRNSVENHLRKIEQSTVGIAFLGVPHCGPDLGAWERFGMQMAQVVKRANQDLLGVLKPGSEMLHLVENDFHKILRHRKDEGSEISITCFYEELNVLSIGQLVPLHSAQIKGYPVYAIHANHMDMTRFPNREDPGYDSILGELMRWQKTALGALGKQSDNKTSTYWIVPRSASRLYTGREELGKRLAEVFSFDASKTPKQQRIFVIVGRGGTGKSEVCLKFAEVHRDDYWGIFWLDARSIATLEQNYISIGRQCDRTEPSVVSVKSWLTNNSQRWLLIVDNADNPKIDYSQYIPPGTRGDILFTTRVAECETYNTVGSEELDDLEPELACRLLYRATGIAASQWKEKEKAAMAVVTVLGSHTLAIIQAGAFIKKGLCSLEQYPDVFKQQKSKLLKFHAEQAQSTYGNVFATFEVSAEYLQKSGSQNASDALDLLHIFAFLHNSGISETMFQRASENGSEDENSTSTQTKESIYSLASHVTRLPEYMQGWNGFQDHIRWREACINLENLSLITIHKHNNAFSISMHSLVHAWAKERQDHQNQCRSWQAAAAIVALSCGIGEDYDPVFAIVQAHVRACVDSEIEDYTHSLSDLEAAQILFKFESVMTWTMDSSLGSLVERMRLRLQGRFSEGHEAVIKLELITGQTYIRQGRSREAIEVLQNALWRCAKVLPDDHLYRLDFQHELAVAYRANWQSNEAVQLLKHIVKVQESLAEDHPDRLASQHELAVCYRDNRQFNKAIELLEHVVNLRGRLAQDYPNRLTSQHELAVCYRDNRQCSKAIELLEHVVKVRERLAEDDPDRLKSEHELALCYRDNGQSNRAIELLEYVVDKEAILAEDDRSRLSSQYNLALFYSEDGQLNRAIALFENVASIVGKMTLAENDSLLLKTQRALATSYRSMERFDEAARVEGMMLNANT